MNIESTDEPDSRGLRNQPVATSGSWSLRDRVLRFGRMPALMGIVNVTPDSFSDGGKWMDAGRAADHALQLVSDGATILDIGGESTRPYSQPVDADEEIRRVVPVIKKLSGQTTAAISIDTSKAAVAEEAIAAGAHIINDVTGLEGDPEMPGVAAGSGAGICVMHMQGTPQTMQDDPNYDDVVEDIFEYLRRRRDQLVSSGIGLEKICLDPGIGFGKSHEQNLQLTARCERFHELGCPVLVGHSRKGFIGRLIGNKEADRDPATTAITLLLAARRIQIVRVHEICKTYQALVAFDACGGIDGRENMAALSDR